MRTHAGEPLTNITGNGAPMDKKRNGQDHSLYRYEDILRAVGRFIDEQGIQDVVVHNEAQDRE
jgi:hypothetical protein